MHLCMKCNKCKSELGSDSKFCSNCGEKIEEESLGSTFDRVNIISRRMWYITGFLRAKGINKDKKKKWYKDYEELLRKVSPELYEDYEDTIKFWKDFVKKHESKNGKKELAHSHND